MFYLPKTALSGIIRVNGVDITNSAFELRENWRHALISYYPLVNAPSNQDYTPPFIDNPSDLNKVKGSGSILIKWTPYDPNPFSYFIWQNSVQIETGLWTGQSISISHDDLQVGTHNYTCVVIDSANNSNKDMVIVSISNPTPITSSTNPPVTSSTNPPVASSTSPPVTSSTSPPVTSSTSPPSTVTSSTSPPSTATSNILPQITSNIETTTVNTTTSHITTSSLTNLPDFGYNIDKLSLIIVTGFVFLIPVLMYLKRQRVTNRQ